jgi:hypothetical protein
VETKPSTLTPKVVPWLVSIYVAKSQCLSDSTEPSQ